MSRRGRSKDLLAVVLIVGVALVYWLGRPGPAITFDDGPPPSEPPEAPANTD